MEHSNTVLPLSTPICAVVLGYGSIGARHAKILEEFGCHVIVVSNRPNVHPSCRSNLREVLESLSVNYVVIANETSKHMDILRELRATNYKGRVLVEKPLSNNIDGTGDLDASNIYLGYQLRYDPLLIAFYKALAGQRIISAELRAGSYLPDWRPGRDYRLTESARPNAGGGVLRDMSHELDYALWLFGPWQKLTASGGHLSSLEIETDDVFVILAEMERCPLVTISLNYLDRQEERRAVVNTTETTICADIVRRTLIVGSDIVFQGSATDIDETYRAETRAMISGNIEYGCTLAEGKAVVEMLAAAEKAAKEERWIHR